MAKLLKFLRGESLPWFVAPTKCLERRTQIDIVATALKLAVILDVSQHRDQMIFECKVDHSAGEVVGVTDIRMPGTEADKWISLKVSIL